MLLCSAFHMESGVISYCLAQRAGVSNMRKDFNPLPPPPFSYFDKFIGVSLGSNICSSVDDLCEQTSYLAVILAQFQTALCWLRLEPPCLRSVQVLHT